MPKAPAQLEILTLAARRALASGLNPTCCLLTPGLYFLLSLGKETIQCWSSWGYKGSTMYHRALQAAVATSVIA
ncbi:rCG22434, partial [Rattus norvegicus]